jgi:UDP-N-acetylglucosamine--N-acetylmuramyl-(pentapeptide) pyrophosphoryl-undecaprenol N-acetylglucosamine transferase
MVVAGGSGGHVFPAVAFAQEFAERHGQDERIVFVTTAGKAYAEAVPKELEPIFCPTQRSLAGVCRLMGAAWGLVAQKRPSIIVGFGGYFSVPFILFGKMRGARVVLHEQNVVPGRANRFLRFFADKIAVSFVESQAYFGRGRKISLTRYPLRGTLQRIDREEALRHLDLRSDLFTLLVVGGSQGAHRINEAVTQALATHADRLDLQVIHICGTADMSSVEAAYRTSGVAHRVFSFLKEMHWAYAAADLAVSRSGAGCVQEMLYFALPSILIPYPFAGGHQRPNAHAVAKTGAAIVTEDALLTPGLLSGLISLFMRDEMRRKTMAHLARTMYDASAQMSLADAVMS